MLSIIARSEELERTIHANLAFKLSCKAERSQTHANLCYRVCSRTSQRFGGEVSGQWRRESEDVRVSTSARGAKQVGCGKLHGSGSALATIFKVMEVP